MRLKKLIIILAMITLIAAIITGCGSASEDEFDTTRDISVVSREEGSGTRGAFVDLMGIVQKDSAGNKKDLTTDEAIIVSKTDVVMTTVAGDQYSIGYISLGSLNEKVKALSIDGVEASVENIQNGTYKVSRPFNIATMGTPSELAQDFIDYIMGSEGQQIAANGYISVDDSASSYSGLKPEGKIVVAGSSSVSPLMEKLAERYMEVNNNATIEIQTSDSTSGMTGAIDGTCDIGMASRELKDSELEYLTPIAIAMDGIAVIVNNNNPIENLTSDQVMEVYTGEITLWNSVQ